MVNIVDIGGYESKRVLRTEQHSIAVVGHHRRAGVAIGIQWIVDGGGGACRGSCRNEVFVAGGVAHRVGDALQAPGH